MLEGNTDVVQCLKLKTLKAFFYIKAIRNAYFLVVIVVVVALLFYVHDKHLRSCRDGQLT